MFAPKDRARLTDAGWLVSGEVAAMLAGPAHSLTVQADGQWAVVTPTGVIASGVEPTVIEAALAARAADETIEEIMA